MLSSSWAQTASAINLSAASEPAAETIENTSLLTERAPVIRDEFTVTSRRQDGSFLTMISSVPISVASEGSWVPVETAIEKVGEGYFVENNPLSPEFGTRSSDSELFTVSDEDVSVTYSLEGSSDVVGVVEGTTAQTPRSEITYRNIAPGADLQYEVSGSSVKESIVLREYTPNLPNTWKWHMTLEGLTPVIDEFGDVLFLDSSRKVRFHTPAPLMWDSSGLDGIRESAEHTVDLTIEHVGGKIWLMSLSANRLWLDSPDRQYPVFVDPTISLGDSTLRAYKSDGMTRSDYVHVGNTRESNLDKYWRTLVKFDYSKLFGKRILKASLTGSYIAGVAALRTGSVNESGCAGYDCVGTKLANWPIEFTGLSSSDSLTLKLSDWVSAREAGHGLVLRGQETPGFYSYKALKSNLYVVWQEFPQPSILNLEPEGSLRAGDPVLLGFPDYSSTEISSRLLFFGGEGDTAGEVGKLFYASEWVIGKTLEVDPGALIPSRRYELVVESTDPSDGIFGLSSVRRSSPITLTYLGTASEILKVTMTESIIAEEFVATDPQGMRIMFSAQVSDPDLESLHIHIEAIVESDGRFIDLSCVASVLHDGTATCSPDSLVSIGSTVSFRAEALDQSSAVRWSEKSTQQVSYQVPDSKPETVHEYYYKQPEPLLSAWQIVSPIVGDDAILTLANPDVFGQWSAASGISAIEYASEFETRNEVQPLVNSIVTSVDISHLLNEEGFLQNSTNANESWVPPTAISALLPDEVSMVAADSRLAANTKVPQSTWGPHYAQFSIQNHTAPNGKKYVKFFERYQWDGSNGSIDSLPGQMGLEFQLDLYSEEHAAGYVARGMSPLRGQIRCPPDAKRFPAAINSGWTYEVYVKTSQETRVAGSLGITHYADVNDYLDDCNRNSISVGIVYPSQIPTYNSKGDQAISIVLYAPKGLEAKSRISGGVQPVSRRGCSLSRNWTDCMGQFVWESVGLGERVTLNVSRRLTAPDLCWVTENYGLVPSRKISCE